MGRVSVSKRKDYDMRPTPNREEFDAMNDATFNDFWDAWFEDATKEAISEDEVQEADDKMKAAFAERYDA